MSEWTTYHRVCAWLLGREAWLAEDAERFRLAEQWREVALRYGDESPAALGCLLALVRASRRMPNATPRWVRSAIGGGVWVMWEAEGNTEAAVLVAALEAAP